MKENWLKTGYQHFALQGPTLLSINSIAKEIGVPRTTFYHYFADKENLIEELLGRYMEHVDDFVVEVKSRCKHLIPDLYEVLEEYSLPLQFSRQLLMHRTEPHYNLIFVKGRQKSNTVLVPLFIRYYNFNIPNKLAEELWDSLTDSWYLRLDPDNLTVDSMQKLTEDIMETLLKFVQSKLFMKIEGLKSGIST
jgi:AcrR family transcriptional regulator